jgi:hypothetical protein
MTLQALKVGLYSKLTSDATLLGYLGTRSDAAKSVYDKIADEDAVYPLLVYRFTDPGGQDDYTLSVRADVVYQLEVEAVAEGYDATAAEQAIERVDTLLTDGTVTVSGYTIMYIRRVASWEDFEVGNAGEVYQVAGARFRIMMR